MPCSTGAGPRAASGAPGTSDALASPSWTRFSPRSVRPAATAARRRSASTVLDTATSVTAAGSRPARAHASSDARSGPGRARRPGPRQRRGRGRSSVRRPAAGAGHLRRRKLGISRSSASYVVGRLAGTGSPTERRRAADQRGDLVVATDRAVGGVLDRLVALALELIEEVALARRAARDPRCP